MAKETPRDLPYRQERGVHSEPRALEVSMVVVFIQAFRLPFLRRTMLEKPRSRAAANQH
jgi:hypothetical protein